jgi:gliding motility-associated-like protein
VSVTSGTSPFTYNWSNGVVVSTPTISVASGLCSGLVTVTVTAADGCISVQNLNINQPTPMASGAPIISLPRCNGDCNGSITLVPNGGVLPYTFTWSPVGNTNPLTNLCANTYSSTITDANGCSITSTYTLSDPPVLALTASVTNASCNTALDGAITTTVTGGVPAYTYTWTGPSAFTSTNTSVNNVLLGTYSLSLVDFAGCRKDTTMTIASTLTVLAVAGPDSAFCQSASYTLNGALSSGGTTYQWFQAPTAVPIATVLTTTVNPPVGTSTFVLVATNGACVHQDTLVLTSNAPPVVDAGPNYTITVLTSTVIGGSPTGPSGSTYSWTPVSTLDNGTLSNPVASNTVNTTYTVTVTDANGCVASDTMHVHIYPAIVIPNGFSPNADGKNDTWVIDNILQFPDCEVEVYNRWGEQLFYSKGYNTPWNGRYKGKELPVGTYYYIIKLNHVNFPNAYTGPLTIFR